MANYVWCTDVHLDHFNDDDEKLKKFAESLVEKGPTGVLITGDISVSPKLVYHLSVIERVVQRPVYFVLGNHDYWGADITKLRGTMKELTNMSSYLKYMPTVPYLALSQTTAVVGHDGWYDALYGDWKNSNLIMNDWYNTADFAPYVGPKTPRSYGAPRPVNVQGVVGECQKLAHEGVTHIMNGIKQAVRYHKTIVVLTHFPPFEQAHVYNGARGDKYAMPFYTSKMLGDMLLDAARVYPDVRFEVFAGHTHGQYDGQIAKNLFVHVGGATYGRPTSNIVQIP